jgi:hypothetical protein
MFIAKIVHHKKEKFVEVVKVSKVQFDPRPGWVFCREVDKAHHNCDVFWVHPTETRFEWVREFTS